MIEPTPTSSSPANLLALATQGKLPKAARWAVTAYTVGTLGWQQGKRLWDKWQERSRYTIAVLGDDELYGELHEWLLARIPEERRRSLVARSLLRPRMVAELSQAGPGPTHLEVDPPRLRMLYDSAVSQTVMVSGHPVVVTVAKPEWASKLGGTAPEWLREEARRDERMTFRCPDAAAHRAVLDFLTEIAAAHEEVRRPKLRIAARWGGWNDRNDLPLRDLRTVVLGRGLSEDLRGDVAEFIGSEAVYNRMGVPWHRGYLFHGPPGTGKTSLARALATEFNLDVWYIPLADLDQDTKLLNLIAEVSAGSMLLLEDIDTLPAATDGDDTTGRVSAAGLLNALDGVATPHGLITVMTTNHLDKLDPRLIRPGRVDRSVQIGHLDAEQFRELIATLMPEAEFELELDRWSDGGALTPADVVDVLKRHVGDAEGATLALKELAHG